MCLQTLHPSGSALAAVEPKAWAMGLAGALLAKPRELARDLASSISLRSCSSLAAASLAAARSASKSACE